MAKGKPTKVDREQDTQTKTKTDTEKQQTNSRLGTVNRTSQTKEIRVNSLEGKLNPRPKIRHQVLEQQERIDHLLTRQIIIIAIIVFIIITIIAIITIITIITISTIITIITIINITIIIITITIIITIISPPTYTTIP